MGIPISHIVSVGAIVDRTSDSGSFAIRNGDAPLKLGDVFTRIYHLSKPETIEDYGKPPQTKLYAYVHLKVTEIHWYGHHIKQLDPGHTSVIKLEGSGIMSIAEFDGLTMGDL